MHDTYTVRTDPIGFPWAKPELVTTRYLTPRARLRRARNRFLASAFVADLTHGWRRTVAILGGVAIAYGAILVIRGAFVVVSAFGVTR